MEGDWHTEMSEMDRDGIFPSDSTWGDGTDVQDELLHPSSPP